ncbi:MAG: hypothetical protein P8182_13585, partial [Deltaproteobacteria bacterium]
LFGEKFHHNTALPLLSTNIFPLMPLPWPASGTETIGRDAGGIQGDLEETFTCGTWYPRVHIWILFAS